MDSIFFILILIAVLSWGIHMPLLTIYVRKYNALSVTIYRNLSILLTMLPFLFFVTWAEIFEIFNHLPLLFLASSCGLIAFLFTLNASRYLPIGLSSAIRQGIYVSAAFVLGFFFFKESASPTELFFVFLILTSAITLSLLKVDLSSLQEKNVKKGIMLIISSGIFHAFSFFLFAMLSRSLNPIVASYFWESLLGILALLYGLVLGGKFRQPKLKLLPRAVFFEIAVISLLVVIGTISYAFAINRGNFAIATSFVTTTIVVYSIAGYILFKEKLNWKQICLMGLILSSIIALKIFSS